MLKWLSMLTSQFLYPLYLCPYWLPNPAPAPALALAPTFAPILAPAPAPAMPPESRRPLVSSALLSRYHVGRARSVAPAASAMTRPKHRLSSHVLSAIKLYSHLRLSQESLPQLTPGPRRGQGRGLSSPSPPRRPA